LPPLYSPLTSPCSLFLSSYAAPRDLHSFPTRRSSDLIGVSARLAKTALAQMSGVELQDIEEIWHGIASPYEPLFAWLEGKAEKPDRKSTRLNSSHVKISYAVFCLKKKKKKKEQRSKKY